MNKKALALAFILALLFTAVVAFSLFSLAFLSDQQTVPSPNIFPSPSPSPSPTEQPSQPPSASPSSSGQLAQSPEPEPQFNLDVVYAYVQGLYDSLVFNITYVSDTETKFSDPIIEVYLIQISSDKAGAHVISNWLFGLGTNSLPMADLMSITIDLNGMFGVAQSAEVYGSGGWTTNKSYLRGEKGGPFDTYIDSETIFITIERIGWVTLDCNSTATHLSSGEAIKQVQLEKFASGFLYNTIVPEDQLSQIDLFNPPYPPGSTRV